MTVPIDSVVLSVEDMIDECRFGREYQRAGRAFVREALSAGMENSIDLQNIMDATCRETPYADVAVEMVPEAFFVGVMLVAEGADLRLPRHSTQWYSLLALILVRLSAIAR